MTGYQMHKVVNAHLRENGFKDIPPQMIYNYISKGYIVSFEENGKRVVSQEVCDEWCAKHIAKKLAATEVVVAS